MLQPLLARSAMGDVRSTILIFACSDTSRRSRDRRDSHPGDLSLAWRVRLAWSWPEWGRLGQLGH